MSKALRILYLQYAPSAGFPPLLNSAELFARAGCSVWFLSVATHGAPGWGLPRGPGITATELPDAPPGWRQKARMCRFSVRAATLAARWQPHWIYVSDVFACLAGLLASHLTAAGVVYHEHDVPELPRAALSRRASVAARRALSRRAHFCIAPNAPRAALLREQTGVSDVAVAWNCPLRREALARPERADGLALRVYYHGSMNPERLPESVFVAVSRVPEVQLRVVGYETIGARGYGERVREWLRRYKIEDRVAVLPTMSRERLLTEVRASDVGLSLMPRRGGDVNHRTMVGASNKPFDYLAAGLPVIVSDLPDWSETYVAPGYGVACDPDTPDSIAGALRSLSADRARMRGMGEVGRQRVLADWNYEHQFGSVLARIVDAPATRA